MYSVDKLNFKQGLHNLIFYHIKILKIILKSAPNPKKFEALKKWTILKKTIFHHVKTKFRANARIGLEMLEGSFQQMFKPTPISFKFISTMVSVMKEVLRCDALK